MKNLLAAIKEKYLATFNNSGCCRLHDLTRSVRGKTLNNDDLVRPVELEISFLPS